MVLRGKLKFKTFIFCKNSHIIFCKKSHLSLGCGVERVCSTWGPRWSPWPVCRLILFHLLNVFNMRFLCFTVDYYFQKCATLQLHHLCYLRCHDWAPNLIAIEFETFRERFLTESNLNLFLGADLNTCDVVLVQQLVEDGDTLGELVLDLPPDNG